MRKTTGKLRAQRGETLVESLIAMLVITLAALMLAGSVVSSARVNAGVKKIVTFPQYASGSPATVTLSDGSASCTLNLNVYEEGGMVYYEKAD